MGRVRCPRAASARAAPVAEALLGLAVVLPTSLLAWGALGWMVGVPIGPATPVVALATSALAMLWVDRRRLRAATLAVGLGVAFLAVGAFVASRVPDVFYDSQLYHLPASFALREGWNPIHEPDACSWRAKYCVPHPGLDHYPKAAWIASASLYALTGDFETGKSVQLLTLLGAWIACVRLLRGSPRLPRGVAFGAASALALNPIAVEQAPSAYVDGWLASALLLFAVLLLDFVIHGRRRSLLLAALALPLPVNLKFTGLLYAAIAALTIGVVAWQTRRAAVAPCLRALVPAATLAVGLLGFHPYLTNARSTGNPFHPVLRSDRPSILQRMAAPEFIERDRLSRFVLAQLSRSRDDDYREREWVIPFGGWRVTPQVDDRFSGFGEPFAAALLLSILAFARVRDRASLVLAGGILASIFATEAGWWARLAPQAWWLAPLAALGCWKKQRDRMLGVAILAILAWVIVATLVVSATHAAASRRLLEATFRSLAEQPAVIVPDREVGVGSIGFALTLRQRVRDAGHPIRVVRTPPSPCVREHRFLGATLCFLAPPHAALELPLEQRQGLHVLRVGEQCEDLEPAQCEPRPPFQEGDIALERDRVAADVHQASRWGVTQRPHQARVDPLARRIDDHDLGAARGLDGSRGLAREHAHARPHRRRQVFDAASQSAQRLGAPLVDAKLAAA